MGALEVLVTAPRLCLNIVQENDQTSRGTYLDIYIPTLYNLYSCLFVYLGKVIKVIRPRVVRYH